MTKRQVMRLRVLWGISAPLASLLATLVYGEGSD